MKLCKQLLIGALVAGLVGFSAWANAGDSGYYVDRGYDYAEVIEAVPVYTDVKVSVPRTRCWDEQVAYQQPASPAGVIIGGLIGAAVGNQLSEHRHRGRGYHHRRHRGDSTVAGALIGAVVGHQISSAAAPVDHVTEQRCQVVDELTTRRELVGYDVRYRYNGREYLTRTDRYPGDRIRVRVEVTPVW